jgi:signal transduction histidine kinase
MTSAPVTDRTAETGAWLRELVLVALRADRPGTMSDLCQVLSRATGARGAVLWEAIEPTEPGETPSVLSLWLQQAGPPGSDWPTRCDDLTQLAFRERSLAIPADLRANPAAQGQLFGAGVRAALPVDYADGGLGVLTLLGGREFSGDAFDVAAELVTVLPDLCSTVRERHTLALVHACNGILHDADIESPDRPLPRERLREHLTKLCTLVAQALQCTEVAIFLEEAPAEPQLFTGSGPGHAPSALSEARHAVNLGDEAGVAYGPEPAMWVPLKSGNQVLGMISCHGASGPPYHFTRSDLPLLQPIAAQVAQYWRNWLFRRADLRENDSWRRLAEGVTSFNRLLSEELRDNAARVSDRDQVAAAALAMVRDVVPESTGAVEIRAIGQRESALHFEMGETLVAGPVPRPPAPTTSRAGSSPAERVYRSRSPEGTTDTREIVRAGLGRDVGWLLSTPIRVGDKAYGVLQGFGPAPAPPENSAQVYEIVSDQLGLYRHLQHTLGRLQEARASLQLNLRSQAETMEDLKHQLGSPLRTAAQRTEGVLRSARFDQRTEAQLRAIRGLCRKAGRVAMSAGVFATLSKKELPTPKLELLGADDLLRLLIAAADDAQVLSDPALGTMFDVDRESVQRLRRRLVNVDASYLQQCVGNVLDNAAKYSYAKTRVRIDAVVSAVDLVMAVTSTGIPVDPDDVVRCLTRNWRGEAARFTTGEGSGIGLWIVDHLMRSMKGSVQIDADGDVTVVRLRLPLA